MPTNISKVHQFAFDYEVVSYWKETIYLNIIKKTQMQRTDK